MNDSAIDNVESATDAEIKRYEKAYRAARTVLDESIEAFLVLEALEDDTPFVQQLRLKRAELETQRSDLQLANIAFYAGNATMRPPSASQVAEIVELSKQAVELTVAKNKAAAFLSLATSALNKFAAIEDIKNG